jgi:serine/threonine protein kinase
MMPPASCPDPDRWQGLLHGSLPESEQVKLSAHLETCMDCQQTLEGLAAGSVEWSGPARQLAPPAGSADSALLRVMEELKSLGIPGEKPSQAAGSKDTSLPFLQPSEKPGYRGRLGHYEVQGIIGRGGMGVVLKAFDTALLRTVAIKVLAPHLAASAVARQRFIREAQAAAQVSHDHVVTIHAVDASGELPFLVMQYIPGISLQERLDRKEGLELEEIARIGKETAAGLAAAHARGLIHRDIKPANILLETPSTPTPLSGGAREERQTPTPLPGGEGPTPPIGLAGGASLAPLAPPGKRVGSEGPLAPFASRGRGARGEGGRVRITDFGLAQTLDGPDLTQSGVVAGTPMYMAPEQARGEALDHRADLFSLGSVLYALCTGQPPFQAGTILATLQSVCTDTPRPIREINPRIPIWLAEVIEKLHAKDPAGRFQSAAEVAELLGDFMSRRRAPTPAAAPLFPPQQHRRDEGGPAGPPAPARRQTWRMALVAGLLLGLVFLAGLGLAGFFGSRGNEADDPPSKVENRKPRNDNSPAALRYRWKAGEKYIYSVRLTAERGDGLEIADGSCSYQVRSAGAEGFTLAYGGSLFPYRRSRQGLPMPAGILTPILFSRFSDIGLPGGIQQGQITVDPLGNCLEAGGQDHLPVVLGNLSVLAIEPLAPEGKKTWKARTLRTLTERDTRSVGMPFEMPQLGPPDVPFPRPLMGPRARQRINAMAAEERVVYTLDNSTANTVVIRKEYELATQAGANQTPRLKIQGKGQITFDVKKGVPRAQQFKATLTESTGGASQLTPLTLTFKLLEGEELKRFLNPPPPPKIERKPLTAADLARALEDLRSDTPARRREAAERFEKAEPKARRAEVAKALAALLDDRDGSTRMAGARALAVWATRDSVPALIRTVEDKDYFIRQAALDALEKLKDARAAEAVACRLPELSDRGKASQVLQGMGPKAAGAVAKYLTHQDLWTRYEACKILKTIGTKGQIPALQKAAKDENPLVAGAAKEAIQTITQRQ